MDIGVERKKLLARSILTPEQRENYQWDRDDSTTAISFNDTLCLLGREEFERQLDNNPSKLFLFKILD